MKVFKVLCALLVALSFLKADKIGDISSIVGVRSNQLIGYGLVIGLNGTGDKSGSKFTMQSISNMLENMSVKVNPNDIKSKNVAAVMITANLNSFAREGDKLDVKVSSIGDAKSLSGGTLIMTPLSAVDGQIYALAQGSVIVGEGDNALSGTIVGGASVEREVPYTLSNKTEATLSLNAANFQNAIRIQNIINKTFTPSTATALDSRTIKLIKPSNLSMVEFLALVQEINIDYTSREKIVVDEKSGTIIAGLDIYVQPIVLTHGNLTLKITKDFAKSGGEKVDSMNLNTETKTLSSNGLNPTVSSVVRALQKMGATPANIISILETMKKSGAIAANIEVL
ncbi:flagellar basal body P-ring protein FlgI [Helicobacter sp. 11S02629-2]|uniref:flagellar basal body P-ring protein FlgI n=1 Tax=Helicobacter sp. 11S02629-2 TaxID=1476195 RepID=UPI000BA507DD|nr:flagellar basal body P-ring protein FlgI [Helicobacter sp. 11S02629-2]PAF42901.1 flagellar biosynthesis protein FlgI [Helicobacter sp. 11S02629-2]